MRDAGETIWVAILGIIGIELINSWLGMVVAVITIVFVISKLLDMRRKNKIEQERRKEEREKHEIEMQLLKKQLDKR